MSRIRIIMLSMLAVLAVGAVSATAAQAVEGPFYKIGGTRLRAFASKKIISPNTNAAGFTLTAGAIKITCKKIGVENGKIIGSNTTNGSGSKEINTFSECTVAGLTGCTTVEEPIKTVLLINRLAYNENPPVTGTVITVLFEPEEGKTFATIKFIGTCTPKEINVELAAMAAGVCGEVWSGGNSVEVNGVAPHAEAERKVGQINFPGTAIKKVFVEDSGVLSEKKCGLIITGGTAATLTGLAEFEIENESGGGALAAWGVFTK